MTPSIHRATRSLAASVRISIVIKHLIVSLKRCKQYLFVQTVLSQLKYCPCLQSANAISTLTLTTSSRYRACHAEVSHTAGQIRQGK